MADKVQRVLEDMVPELLDLGKRNVFSEEEIREIIRNRRNFEYKISSRTPLIKDYLDYLTYEYELERIRYNRTRSLGLKKRTIGDYSIIRLIHFIFKRALRKFPFDEKLWLQNIDFCLKSGSSKALQRNLIAALRNNPINNIFWLIMSDRELQNGNIKEARSAILLGLRVNNDSLMLWKGFSELETSIAYKKYLSSFTNVDISTENSVNKKSNINSLMPIIDHAQKRIKQDFKKQALILFIYRQHFKLKKILSEDEQLTRIEGMVELENKLIDCINNFKSFQPLLSLFTIVHNVINDNSDILQVFEYEINNILSNSSTEYIIITLIFICRIIYNCINTQFEDFQIGNIELQNEEYNIVDFGFHISDSVNDVEKDYNEKNTNSKNLNLNISTWYSQISIRNIILRDNNYLRNIIKLLKLDPNLWNFCFLEDIDSNELIEILSKFNVNDIEDREICKDQLLEKELIYSIKQKINIYFSNDLNKNKLKTIVTNLIQKVNSFELSTENLIFKQFLIEALNSFIENKEINHFDKELYILQESQISNNKTDLNQIFEILQQIKFFILKNSTNIQDSDQILIFVNLVNKLFDFIQFQVDQDQQIPENFDMIYFSKCIYWIIFIIHNHKFNKEFYSDLSKLSEKVIYNIINIIPRWFTTKKIPGFLFNALLLYSILEFLNEYNQFNDKTNSLIIEYLQNQDLGIDIKLEDSIIIKIINDNFDKEYINKSINSLMNLSVYNKWLLNDSITIISKSNRYISTITYIITGIALLNISLEKYILCLISENNKQNIELSEIQNVIQNLFNLWNRLLLISNDIKDFSNEFNLAINIRYILFIKLIDYLKMKRYIKSNIFQENSMNNLLNLTEFISHIKKNNRNLLTRNLSSDINISNLARIPIDDPQFLIVLNKISNYQLNKNDIDHHLFKNKLNTQIIANILNTNEILIIVARFIDLNYS